MGFALKRRAHIHWVFWLALFAAAVSPSSILAAQIEIKTFSNGTISVDFVSIEGDIGLSDDYVLQEIIRRRPDVSLVVLESPGGLVRPALEIGRAIRANNLATATFDLCSSACAYIWMAGTRKYLAPHSSLGFHSPYVSDQENKVSSVANAIVGAYLNELDYSENIVAYATAAEPNAMQWLTQRDAELLGLSFRVVEAKSDMFEEIRRMKPWRGRTGRGTWNLTTDRETPTPPAPDKSAGTNLVVSIQTELNRLGCNAGPADGIWNQQTRQALVDFGAEADVELADHEPDVEILNILKRFDEPICGGFRQAAKGTWYISIFENVDFWGGDKYPEGVAAPGADECAMLCAADIDCKLFTYNPRKEMCFIKTDIDIIVTMKGLVSGMMTGAGDMATDAPRTPVLMSDFLAVEGERYTGLLLPAFQPPDRIASIDACLRYCHADSNCTYLTFDPGDSGASCKIRRHWVAGTAKDGNATSFRRQNELIRPKGKPIELTIPRYAVDPDQL